MRTRSLLALILFASALTVVAASPVPAANGDPLQSDFNGDGVADLAVGVPGKAVTGKHDAGAVSVIYGSEGGPVGEGSQLWTQNSPGVPGAAAPDDRFGGGSALAAGDLNGDGFADLAIGADDQVGAKKQAGSVTVLYGSETGLSSAGAQLWTQALAEVPGLPQANDGFGTSLTVGDFDGDTFGDLAVGAPGDRVSGKVAGAVIVLYGTSAGLAGAGSQLWTQDTLDIEDAANLDDQFGFSLAAGDLGHGPEDDLAASAPFEEVGQHFTLDAGAVNVLFGSPTGLSAEGDQVFSQAVPGVASVPDPGDLFGWDVAIADFGKGSPADLAVGVPGELVNGRDGGGAVNILYGSEDGVTTAGFQDLRRDTTGILGLPGRDDGFGSSLAVADFGNGPEADLAVGVRADDLPGAIDGGTVNVLYGSPTGLSTIGNQLWSRQGPALLGAQKPLESFGWDVVAANLGGGTEADLVVAVPFQNVGPAVDAGAVAILFGSATGLSATGDAIITLDTTDVVGVPMRDDQFGSSLGPGP
jgi:FG-GAP repeat